MKWIDLPPVWLLAGVAVAWFWRWPAAWNGVFWAGIVCLGLAAVLTVAALIEFARARTTIVPREVPSALITGGVFRLSRNPIYVADLLILAAFSLIWGSIPGLVLVPFLGWIIQTRFIAGEEARLSSMFGAEFEAYRSSTRRWI
ncbi:MAG: isoprenylcysteine carboxylmethyltransferase family protein [Silicimonas sp.]